MRHTASGATFAEWSARVRKKEVWFHLFDDALNGELSNGNSVVSSCLALADEGSLALFRAHEIHGK